MNTYNFIKRINELSKIPKRCILCHNMTHNMGFFVPNHLKDFGINKPPEGKIRGIVYPICENHNLKKDKTLLKIEAILKYTGIEFGIGNGNE